MENAPRPAPFVAVARHGTFLAVTSGGGQEGGPAGVPFPVSAGTHGAGWSEMSDGEVTKLLQTWSAGDPEAAEQLLSLVYDELRHIAARQLRQERGSHTLQPTAV